MGEIADMMLDGTLCEGCGGFMGSAGAGYVRYCSACSRDHKTDMQVFNSLKPPQKKVSCPVCKKRVKATGLADHTRDAHVELHSHSPVGIWVAMLAAAPEPSHD